MKYTTPESVGCSSKAIREYIEVLEEHGLATHDLILARGDDIFFEGYWAPFHKEFLHRMYSVSKSFVSIAVGFCEQEGLLNLDDRIAVHFPKETEGRTAFQHQTIRDMLLMATEKRPMHWFNDPVTDRVQYYFDNERVERKAPGTLFNYDSSGSFVLTALVERLTGMPFMEYLRIKLFDKIGVSKEAHCLKCPGGHSWGDSAILCTAQDLLLTARFVLNKGRWNGEQLLNEAYLTQATSALIDNNTTGLMTHSTMGYGYQFWRTYDNSFFFNGMGCQLAVCVPDKDLILVYNADNQNDGPWCKELIISEFFRRIARPISDEPLAQDASEQERLKSLASTLRLTSARGQAVSPIASQISGTTWEMYENAMGISSFRLELKGDTGTLVYTNAQGEKRLPFGMCQNVFGKFPQEGYSKDVGHTLTKGHYYDCAVSAAWVEPHKLFVMVQAIDDYLGRLNMIFSFKGDKCYVQMLPFAEDFFQEYSGFAEGYRK